jgi:molybdate transport system permease protein
VDLSPLVLSFEVSIIALIVSAVIGVAVATLLANARFPGREVLDVLITVPMVMPPTVLGYYVLTAIGHKSFIGKAYFAVFGTTIVFTKTGLVVAAVVGAVPIVVKSGRAALEGVDRTLIQAARTLGAGRARAFFTVQLPLSARGLVAALMLAFAKSLGDFGVTLMVAGNIPGYTQTASLRIFDDIQAHREREALAMVLIFSAIAFLVLYGVNKLTERHDG